MIPLGLLSPGEQGEILAIRGRGAAGSASCFPDTAACDGRIGDMGLRVGKLVEVLSNDKGPVLIRVDEARIAVDRGTAMKIMVRRGR
jgi:ferrous iron transport protein A